MEHQKKKKRKKTIYYSRNLSLSIGVKFKDEISAAVHQIKPVTPSGWNKNMDLTITLYTGSLDILFQNHWH